MLANAPDVNGYTRTNRPLPEERAKDRLLDEGSAALPVSRMGLEQEFFLVDREGALSDLADLFLWECREEARAEGLDPRCFQGESVMGLVEITTPPSHGVEEIISHYLSNLELALGVASELGLALYPLGT